MTNIYVRAASFARSNMGHGRPSVEEMRACANIDSIEEGVENLCSDMIESDTYDIIVTEAKGWIQILKDNSEKQCQAAWPDMMSLFAEAGV